jgi:opacity protein-like surface antigen
MKITFFTVLTILSLTGTAQTGRKWHSGSMTPVQGIGISFQQFSGLNSRIAAFPQYKTLRDYMGTISLGSRNIRKNFISEFSLTGANSMSGNRNRRSSNLRSLGAQLNLGYDVIPAERIMLYPMAGIGVEGLQAKFYKDNSAVNFNDVLGSSSTQNAISAVKFTNSFLTYNLGLGFSFKPAKCNGSIGIQGSYTGSFDSRAWKSSDRQELANAPEDRLSRFQVGLVFSNMMHGYKK